MLWGVDLLHLPAFQVGSRIGFYSLGFNREDFCFHFGTKIHLVVLIIYDVPLSGKILFHNDLLVILTLENVVAAGSTLKALQSVLFKAILIQNESVESSSFTLPGL